MGDVCALCLGVCYAPLASCRNGHAMHVECLRGYCASENYKARCPVCMTAWDVRSSVHPLMVALGDVEFRMREPESCWDKMKCWFVA